MSSEFLQKEREGNSSTPMVHILPSVTIIIPCCNAEKWIARAVNSALNQYYPKLEIIVIDDGSTDKSLQIIKSFGSKIRWQSGPNLGAGSARNLGLELARSSYVLFLDADDYIEGNYIVGLASAAMKTQAELTLGPSIIELFDGKRSPTRFLDGEIDKSELILPILKYQIGQTGSVLWCRDFLNRIGAWDPSLGRMQDIFLILKGISSSSRIASSKIGASVYVQHNDSARLSKKRTIDTELSVKKAYEEFLVYNCVIPTSAKKLIAKQLYDVALSLFRFGCKEEAVAGFNLSKRLGLRGHAGNRSHRILCYLIGLEKKETFAQFIKKFRQLEGEPFR
jgi:glycosyltransferase involved in cell wall biosynthesis